MAYFIYQGVIDSDRPFIISGDEANHIRKSRRIRKEESIHIQDSRFRRFSAQVVGIARHGIELLPQYELPTIPESKLEISLFQALIKEKAIDSIIQKTTELGVSNIFVFGSKYSQVPKDKSILEKKLFRWKKIAQEACKQSDRARPPQLAFIGRLSDYIDETKHWNSSDFPVLLLDQSGPPFSEIELKTPKGCGIVVGPEGGWKGEEINFKKTIKVSIGHRVLRADTAAIVSTGILQFLFGDLQQSHQPTDSTYA